MIFVKACAYRYKRRLAPNHEYAVFHINRTVAETDLVTDDLTRNGNNVEGLGFGIRPPGVRDAESCRCFRNNQLYFAPIH